MKISISKNKGPLYFRVYLSLIGWYCFHSILASSYTTSFFGINISSASILIRYLIPLLLIGLFLFKIGKKPEMSIHQALLIGCICITFCVIFCTIPSVDLIMTVMFVIAFPAGIDLKRVAKVFYIWCTIGILCVVGSFHYGLIPEYVRKRGILLRHSAGFVSANAFANSVAYTALAYLYYRIDRWKVWDSIFLFVLDIYIYMQTRSRMSCLFILAICIFGLLYKKIKKAVIINAICLFDSWLSGIFTVFIIGIVKIFSGKMNSPIYQIINSFVSDRLKFSIQYFNKYGIHVLGQRIQTISIRESAVSSAKWAGIDCSYMNILIRYGIITGFGFMLFYFWLGKRLNKRADLTGAFIVFLILIFSLTENCLYQIQNNFTLFILAHEIYAKIEHHVDKYK